jgi:hypothetical protein
MTPPQTPNQFMQATPPVREDSLSSIGEPSSEADQSTSRWEPGILVAQIADTDPYVAWLHEHQSKRYSATGRIAPTASRRLHRNPRPKAPWEAIAVTLCPDDR